MIAGSQTQTIPPEWKVSQRTTASAGSVEPIQTLKGHLEPAPDRRLREIQAAQSLGSRARNAFSMRNQAQPAVTLDDLEPPNR